jgi:hypothetical protein
MSSDRFVSDVVLVVDEHAMFAVGPVEPGSWSAPAAHELPVAVELQQRWRGLRTLRLRYSAWTMQDPDVIVAIDRHTRRLPQHPAVGQLWRPRGIDFEDGISPGGRLRLSVRTTV